MVYVLVQAPPIKVSFTAQLKLLCKHSQSVSQCAFLRPIVVFVTN